MTESEFKLQNQELQEILEAIGPRITVETGDILKLLQKEVTMTEQVYGRKVLSRPKHSRERKQAEEELVKRIRTLQEIRDRIAPQNLSLL